MVYSRKVSETRDESLTGEGLLFPSKGSRLWG